MFNSAVLVFYLACFFGFDLFELFIIILNLVHYENKIFFTYYQFDLGAMVYIQISKKCQKIGIFPCHHM